MLGVFQARSPQEQLSFTCHLPYATCVLCTWSHLIPQQPQRRTIVSVWQRKNTQCSQALSNLLEVEQPISRRQASKLVHWTQNRAYHTILPATTPNENWKYMRSEHIEIVLIFQSLWAHLGFLFKLKKKICELCYRVESHLFLGQWLACRKFDNFILVSFFASTDFASFLPKVPIFNKLSSPQSYLQQPLDEFLGEAVLGESTGCKRSLSDRGELEQSLPILDAHQIHLGSFKKPCCSRRT